MRARALLHARARGRACGHTCAGADRTPHAHARRRAHGKGVFRKRNGNVYEGEYKADKCDGFGVYRFTNGDKYEGEWKQGLKSGEGTISWHTGRSFQGRFADDCPIIGKLAEADGKVYRVTYDGSKKFSNGAQPESRELIPTESGGVEEGDSGDAGKPNPLTPSLMAAAAKLREGTSAHAGGRDTATGRDTAPTPAAPSAPAEAAASGEAATTAGSAVSPGNEWDPFADIAASVAQAATVPAAGHTAGEVWDPFGQEPAAASNPFASPPAAAATVAHTGRPAPMESAIELSTPVLPARPKGGEMRKWGAAPGGGGGGGGGGG